MCTNICTHNRNEKGKIIMTLLDWEQRKLGEIVQRINRKNVNLTSTLPLTISAQYGLIDQRNFFDKQIASEKLEKYILLKKGEFAYNKSYSRNYPFGAIKRLNNYKFGALSTLYIAFKPVTIDTEYLEQYFDSTKWYKEIYKRATEGARNHGLLNISSQDFFNSLLTIPLGTLEQKKIAKLLKTISSLLDLQQRKLEQLTLLKKAMLQQILTTNDYPKIRFRGFTNVWDQRRLEKIAKITTGKLDANAMVKNGKYDFYTSGIKKFKINTAAFEGPAITIAGNGATVGYMHLADGKFNAYQRTYVLNQFTVNRLFLFYSVKKVLPRSIYQSARTGNIPYIVLNMITDLKINIPKEKEQKKIGELFTEIQAILINQKNRLRCIKDLKQYLLQNIFL